MILRFDPRPRDKNGYLTTKKSRAAYLKMFGYTPAQWNQVLQDAQDRENDRAERFMSGS